MLQERRPPIACSGFVLRDARFAALRTRGCLGVAFFAEFQRTPLKRLKTGASFPSFFASFPPLFASFPPRNPRQKAKIGGFSRLPIARLRPPRRSARTRQAHVACGRG